MLGTQHSFVDLSEVILYTLVCPLLGGLSSFRVPLSEVSLSAFIGGFTVL